MMPIPMVPSLPRALLVKLHPSARLARPARVALPPARCCATRVGRGCRDAAFRNLANRRRPLPCLALRDARRARRPPGGMPPGGLKDSFMNLGGAMGPAMPGCERSAQRYQGR